jgi:hypothetical protein
MKVELKNAPLIIIIYFFNMFDNHFLRRLKDLNFQLMPGKFYTLEELRQKGYTLKEITLEGIVNPEAIPEGEEYVIYEVEKMAK